MSIPALHRCPSLLTAGHHTYSPPALRRMFDGRQVSHILPYDAPWESEAAAEPFMDNSKRVSLSGVQEKYSLIQDKRTIRLTEQGEHGTHILKPMPVQFLRPQQLPANEHLTMQIAGQVYGIHTAPSALIFFTNGEPAYITRRFDVNRDGSKKAKEDFATLAGKSLGTAGKHFKYDSSYEEIGALIRKYAVAWPVEIEKFFALVLFNYLFSNGDAHLKNFAILETDSGDFTLSPAYDLVNTRLHVDDHDFAFEKGLFEDGFRSTAYEHYGHAAKADFSELSRRIGIKDARAEKILQPFLREQEAVASLVSRSFLDTDAKITYVLHYKQRLKSLTAER
jgi:serine/threonine-protein kinase HipA